MVASTAASHRTSECAWYFVAYTFDTTLGVTIAVLLHSGIVRAARWHIARFGAIDAPLDEDASWVVVITHCGEYGKSF